ncbi:HAMP domain-containing sensor histidine kinase [Terasakiella sp. A23]|uniref:ATP-binding response regulator n=1 Tax=Terasakiella sp. FCG-A23 TaxID=3080561 RepID=UPI002952F37D|nr:HAMP domain-containing sensor histidine kinase [Terasakiella sp. A23]MDV7339925.1 HAMP domain-containing sensor histidine kinase [Terasakiella sp. A23]
MNWRAETYRELLDQAYKGSIPTSVFSVCAGLMIALMLSDHMSTPVLSIWLALFLGTQFLRAFTAQRYQKAKPNDAFKYWEKWIYISVIPSSVMWGVLPILSFPHIDAMDRVIISVFLSTAPTAQLHAIGSIFRLWLISMVLLLIPMCLTWLFFGFEGTVLGLIGLLYAAYLFGLAKTFSKLMGDKIELSFVAHDTSKAKSTFLATASHDLRQPLHAITMSLAAALARLTGKDNPTKEEVKSAVHSIRAADTSVDGLSRLLNALLDISKIESGTLKPSLAKIPLTNLLEHIAQTYQPRALEKGIRLKVMPCSLNVHCDPVFLQRIIGNLVSNAVQHTEKGRVLVGCKRQKDKVIIQVIDDGPGIAPEKFRDIFSQFNQLDNPGRQPANGQGLGLSIADGLSCALDLTISVNSEVGKGSAFYLEVPLSQVEAETKDTKTPRVSNRKTHLVVLLEPNSTILDETAVQIREWGYRVLAFQSTEEAQSLRIMPNLLITAQDFPNGLTGLEASNILCGTWKTQAPTLMMISDFSPEKIIEATQTNCKLIPSPPDPKEFRQTIQEMITS